MYLENSYLIENTVSSIAELIELGNYDEVDSNINDSNFWIDPNISNYIWLAHSSKSLSTDSVFEKLRKLDVQSVTMTEVLLFGAQYPKINSPVVALAATYTKPRASKYVVGLTTSNEGKRKLGLYLMDSTWHKDYRFAVVTL